MTKGELIRALAGFEDDIPVLIEVDPKGETVYVGVSGVAWKAVSPTSRSPKVFYETSLTDGTAVLVIRSDT